MNYLILYFGLSFLCSCNQLGKNVENNIQGIYVIRYSKLALDDFFKETETYKIDFDKVDYFLPLTILDKKSVLIHEIISEGLLIKNNELFLLPSSDLQDKVDYFFEAPPVCEEKIVLPDQLKERNFFMANTASEFVYVLYTLRGKVVKKQLENSFKNKILLNSNLSIPENTRYFDCNFIWEIDQLVELIPPTNRFIRYRFTE